MSLEAKVKTYRKLRDAMRKLEADTKKKVAILKSAMEKIEVEILQELDEMGAESVKTPYGTAYKSKKTGVKVTDWEATLEYIKSTDRFDLLNRSVSKTAVQEMLENTGEIPPGLDWYEEIIVNVRK